MLSDTLHQMYDKHTPNMIQKNRLILFLLVSFFAVLIWSLIRPHDYFTWFLEAVPALGALVILFLTYSRFPLTGFAYFLIWMHALILLVGAHYTYAEVPLFNWIRDAYGLARNSYDGVGHFAQGFFPAIIAREILLRTSPLKRGKWLAFIVVSICLAFSAFYELIEWWVAIGTGTKADAFLGAQGDIWDTQKDMALCLTGSILSLLLFSRFHDKALARLEPQMHTDLH